MLRFPGRTADGAGPGLAREIARAWYDSESHRTNVLDPRYAWTGVGLADGRDGVYATQVFAQEIHVAGAAE